MRDVMVTARTDLAMLEAIRSYLCEVTDAIGRVPVDRLEQVIYRLEDARRKRRAVYICGNGGSAATSIHFACDLAKGAWAAGKPAIRARSLCENTSLVTAWANDVCYDDIFAQCVEPWLEAGDVLIAISGSGNSQNVINAVSAAKVARATTIGFTGFDGGKLKDIVDICVTVPSDSMEQVEDVHSLLCHLITTCLRSSRAGDGRSDSARTLLFAPRDLRERVALGREEPAVAGRHLPDGRARRW